MYYVTIAEIFGEFCRKLDGGGGGEAKKAQAKEGGGGAGGSFKQSLAYLGKIVGHTKKHARKFKIAECASLYCQGIHHLHGGELKAAKWCFETSVAVGKTSKCDAIVAKSYFLLGTNTFAGKAGPGPRERVGVVGGNSYAVVAPEVEEGPRKGGDKGHVHYLHRAFSYAKQCDMHSLSRSVRKAIDNCIEDDASQFEYGDNSTAGYSGGPNSYLTSEAYSQGSVGYTEEGGGSDGKGSSEWMDGGVKINIGGGGG